MALYYTHHPMNDNQTLKLYPKSYQMEKQHLYDYFLDLTPLPIELRNGTSRNQFIKLIKSFIQHATYDRKRVIQLEGTAPDRIWFIEEGWARGYYFDETKKEKTEYIWNTHALIIDPDNFMNQTRSDLEIEIASNTVLSSLAYTDMMTVFREFPFMIDLYESLKTVQHQYSSKSFYHFDNLHASDRYNELNKRYPKIGTVINRKDIASFLNITPQYLSKIS